MEVQKLEVQELEVQKLKVWELEVREQDIKELLIQELVVQNPEWWRGRGKPPTADEFHTLPSLEMLVHLSSWEAGS